MLVTDCIAGRKTGASRIGEPRDRGLQHAFRDAPFAKH